MNIKFHLRIIFIFTLAIIGTITGCTRSFTLTPITPITAPTDTLTVTSTPVLMPGSPTPAPIFTGSPTPIYSATSTNTLVPTATWTLTGSSTLVWTDTPTWTLTPSNTNTPLPTSTWTFTFVYTNTLSPTWTDTPTNSLTPTFSPSGTWFTSTPTSTPTARNTATSTNTPTRTSTFTATSTKTFTPTGTWDNTPTITPTPTNSFTVTSTPTLNATATACIGGPVLGDNAQEPYALGGGVITEIFVMNTTASFNTTLVSLSAYVTVGTIYNLGVYANGSGSPSALLAQTGPQTAVATGWGTQTLLPSLPVLAGTNYWLAIGINFGQTQVKNSPGAPFQWANLSDINNLPAPFTGGTMANGQVMSLYATGCPAVGPPTWTPLPTNTPTATPTGTWFTPTLTITPTTTFTPTPTST